MALLMHAFLRDPHRRDQCDFKGSDEGRTRTCMRPAREHLDHLTIGELPEVMPDQVHVEPDGPYVNLESESASLKLLMPDEALALARALIFGAYRVMQGPRNG